MQEHRELPIPRFHTSVAFPKLRQTNDIFADAKYSETDEQTYPVRLALSLAGPLPPVSSTHDVTVEKMAACAGEWAAPDPDADRPPEGLVGRDAAAEADGAQRHADAPRWQTGSRLLSPSQSRRLEARLSAGTVATDAAAAAAEAIWLLPDKFGFYPKLVLPGRPDLSGAEAGGSSLSVGWEARNAHRLEMLELERKYNKPKTYHKIVREVPR